MEITFKNKKFQKMVNANNGLVKTFGKHCAQKIQSRLDDLEAAVNLEVFKTLPGRCHELKGNRKGQLSLDLEHPLRLIFTPSDENMNRKEDGGLDWRLVKAIVIIDVEDTHE